MDHPNFDFVLLTVFSLMVVMSLVLFAYYYPGMFVVMTVTYAVYLVKHFFDVNIEKEEDK